MSCIKFSLVLLVAMVVSAMAKPQTKEDFARFIPHEPYEIEYSVKDDTSGAHFSHEAKHDGQQQITGVYKVQLPNGLLQIVSYSSTNEGGYVPVVSYEGTATARK